MRRTSTGCEALLPLPPARQLPAPSAHVRQPTCQASYPGPLPPAPPIPAPSCPSLPPLRLPHQCLLLLRCTPCLSCSPVRLELIGVRPQRAVAVQVPHADEDVGALLDSKLVKLVILKRTPVTGKGGAGGGQVKKNCMPFAHITGQTKLSPGARLQRGGGGERGGPG